MAKVSIGLRGWRFDEDEVFDEDGEIRPIDEIPEDARNRLIRLSSIMGEPCSACWLIHGEENLEQCNVGTIVYGEPLAEVLLCDEHETDFIYWFREEGGEQYAGSSDLQDAFHEWFLEGNRAPESYPGLRHVDEEPDALPDAVGEAGIAGVECQVDDPGEQGEPLNVDTDNLDV